MSDIEYTDGNDVKAAVLYVFFARHFLLVCFYYAICVQASQTTRGVLQVHVICKSAMPVAAR